MVTATEEKQFCHFSEGVFQYHLQKRNECMLNKCFLMEIKRYRVFHPSQELSQKQVRKHKWKYLG